MIRKSAISITRKYISSNRAASTEINSFFVTARTKRLLRSNLLEPANVESGDIVQANYDGESWFRGGVVFFDTSTDIAYDDGDFGAGVNIRCF